MMFASRFSSIQWRNSRSVLTSRFGRKPASNWSAQTPLRFRNEPPPEFHCGRGAVFSCTGVVDPKRFLGPCVTDVGPPATRFHSVPSSAIQCPCHCSPPRGWRLLSTRRRGFLFAEWTVGCPLDGCRRSGAF